MKEVKVTLINTDSQKQDRRVAEKFLKRSEI